MGRAVAALAADPDRARWNGASMSSGALAQEYGFTDVDGTRPDAWRYIVEVQEPGSRPTPPAIARRYQPSVPAGPLNGPTRSCVIQPP